MKRILVAGAIASVAVIPVATACHSGTPQPTASQKAQAEQGYKNAKALANCLPKGTVAQIRLSKSLTSASGRSALVARCGIPPAHREATEAKILDAAEHGHLTTKAGRVTFITVTLPNILESEQA